MQKLKIFLEKGKKKDITKLGNEDKDQWGAELGTWSFTCFVVSS